MEDLIKIAANEIGVKEIPGDKHNKKIIEYAKEAGFDSIKDDETPWCSVFVNWCCKKAGLQRTHKSNARSWLSVGLPVTAPNPGDVVIFWRSSPHSWKGHVGFFMGFNKNHDKVFVLGGNQNNCVSVQAYGTSRVLGYRRLSSSENIDIPASQPELKNSSRGSEVKKLQFILNELGYDCGAVDGIFGIKTETQLKKLQVDEEITVTGIYNNKTKNGLESIFLR